MKMKSVMSLFLVMILVLSLFPLSAFAATARQKFDFDDIVYFLNSARATDTFEPIAKGGSIVISEPMPIEQLLESEQLVTGDSFGEKGYPFASKTPPTVTIDVGDIIFETISQTNSRNDPNTTRAPSCDIFASSLSASGSQPFNVGQSASFTFTIGNYGPDTAMAVGFTIYVAGQSAGSYNTGVFPGNTQGTVPISVTLSGIGGTYPVRIEASAVAPVDSNPNNNAVQADFQWLVSSQQVDLITRHFQNNTSGDTPFEATQTQQYSFNVSNYGPHTTVSAYAELTVLKNGNVLYPPDRLNLPQIPAGYGCTVTYPLDINQSGSYDFQASAYDPGSTEGGPSDNVAYKTFTCIPDGCALWSVEYSGDKQNISIALSNDIVLKDVVDAADDWNGISSAINISTVDYAANLSNASCYVSLGDVDGEYRGEFRSNAAYGSNYYSIGYIIIQEGAYNLPGLELIDGEVIRHEIGHFLSLHHPHTSNPSCHDNSVMQYIAELHSYTVTDHDERALIKKWGP